MGSSHSFVCLGSLWQTTLDPSPIGVDIPPMQYDFRGSPGTRKGSPSSLPRYSYRSSSAMETGPGAVPLQMYQQVAEELESARQQVSQLSSENQRLRSLHQQLSGEIAQIDRELQDQLGHILKRLQQIGQTTRSAAGSEGGSQPFQSTHAPELSAPEARPSYDFLNRLKRRQTSNGASSSPSNSYPEAYASNASFSASFELPRRPTPSATVPPPGFACPRNDMPAEPHPRAGYQVPVLDELMQDRGGTDPYTEAYPTGVYQRVRDQQRGSQGSTVLWIAAAVILVIGSFGLGFVAVQLFLRNDPPPPHLQAP
ncbi:MAG: hypothetical protein ACUVRV_04400 [Cyanobacteriota bacterium]